MPRKAIDPRIPALIKKNVKEGHRSFFVIVGDRGKDQIPNLHWILSQSRVQSRPNVLWCYKKELGFTSHRKKREAKIRRDIKKGLRDVNAMEDPFELFVSVTDIRYTYYKESDKILGQTFGFCILQDFEALTPNLLARTIETVEGGGAIVLLLKTMTSLKQLYTMAMDVHARYRTEARHDVVARFNERFILSLASCESCLIMDDELNVLPVSAGKDTRIASDLQPDRKAVTQANDELREMQESLQDSQPVGSLVSLARTSDQAKALLTFVESITAKTMSSTVSLTAARGRGKSAALGLATAAAVAHGYANIFITSPSPENLKTLFEFIFKGFSALGYEEHLDYDVAQSANPEFGSAIVRVNIHKHHRQTIQYMQPQDAQVLGQAELVIIDEAAAIPLPLVRSLMGPYLVFLASTINGYEGTGRSLSLKLLQQLREQSKVTITAASGASAHSAGHEDRSVLTSRGGRKVETGKTIGRSLREIKLEQPIRYAPGDAVEQWLNKALCLDAMVVPGPQKGSGGSQCPHPSTCELFHVNRDTLFSHHPASEAFLQRMMALYVASHYKNSPNDLQLLSDAPAHQLFALLPPTPLDTTELPTPLVVVQVALEGHISKASILASLSRGQRAGGDLIPWLISQQYQDDGFAQLSGARVVRIATHPDYTKMGYGSRALDLLEQFYRGQLVGLDELTRIDESGLSTIAQSSESAASGSLNLESIGVRPAQSMPPLLTALNGLEPPLPMLDWIGVSYGLTNSLMRFWKRGGYVPVYLRQTPNELTGEHTSVMLKLLKSAQTNQETWLDAFARDYRKRFINLLSYKFREFGAIVSLSMLEATETSENASRHPAMTISDLQSAFSPFDLKRLDRYASNMLDYHVILDLLPQIGQFYFLDRIPRSSVKLSGVQSAILLALGLQRKSIEDIENELHLPVSQCLALFVKIMRKFTTFFDHLLHEEHGKAIPLQSAAAEFNSTQDVEQDNEEGRSEVDEANETGGEEDKVDVEAVVNSDEQDPMKARQRELIDAMDLSRYAIKDDDTLDASQDKWKQAKALIDKREAPTAGPPISIKPSTNGERDQQSLRKLKRKHKDGESARELYKKEEARQEKQRKKGKGISRIAARS